MTEDGADTSEAPPAPEPRAAGRQRRRRRLLLLLLLAMGAAYRLALALRLPVGYDEVFVIAVGLIEMAASRVAWLIETPMQRSSALAPLWWWLEYLPFRALGDVSLTALRLVPMACSLAIPCAGYACAARRFGRRAALLFAAFLALSDVLAFCTVRSDFFEALLVLLMIPVVCGVGRRSSGALRGCCWAGMALTFLGKALFVIGLNVLAEAAILVLVSRDRSARIRSLALSAVVAAVPVAAWLMLAQRHYGAGPIAHEAVAAAPGVVDLVFAMTLDYGKTKAHVVGPAHEAALVWLDADTWPTNALSAGVMAVVVLLSAATVRQGLDRGWTRRRTAQTGLLVWSLAAAAFVILRGATGARFHLMYLPALWLLAALTLVRAIAWVRPRSGWIAATCLMAATPALGWHSWVDLDWSVRRAVFRGTPLLALAGWLAWSAASPRAGGRPLRTAAWFTLPIAALALLLTGPLRWAPAAKFEPMYQKDPRDASRRPWTESMLALEDFRGGRQAVPRRPETLEVFLSNYFRTRRPADLDRALYYAHRAVDLDAQNVLAWQYLGLALDEAGADRAERRRVWEQALRLKPESAFIQQRLRALAAEGGPS